MQNAPKQENNSHLIPSRLKVIFLIFSLLLFIVPAKGQLTINNTPTIAQVISSLTGPGVNAFNPIINCPDTSYALFAGGNTTNIGLDQGLLLTSGIAETAIGPNVSPGSSFFSGGVNGDPELNSATTVATLDGCIVEFDFQPACDTIQIAFVFASEEYLEFVQSGVTDCFGFFISGPGIVGTQNLAVVPSTSIPINIDNINDITNSIYYIDNPGGTTIEYDGFTVPLLAKSAVMPCSTYHLKIGIADGGDAALDSGVFLEANGIQCSTPQVEVTASSEVSTANFGVEGCVDAIFTFVRAGSTTFASTVNFTSGGSATPGVDYTPLPGSITFPIGEDSVVITIPVFSDLLNEGIENIFIVITDTVCNTSFSDTAFIEIHEPPVPDAGPDQSFCSGDTITVGGPGILGGTYVWSPLTGLLSPNDSISQLVLTNSTANPITSDYIVTLTDSLGCVASDTTSITVSQYPSASFNLVDTICTNTPTVLTYTGSGNAASTYDWLLAGSPVGMGTGMGPHTISWPLPGTYQVSLQVTVGACNSLVYVDSIVVAPMPTVDIGVVAGQCVIGNSFDFDLTGSFDPIATISWQFWPGATPQTSNIEDPTGIVYANSGNAFASVQVSQYGCVSNIDTVSFHVYPQADPLWNVLSGPQCASINSYDFEAVGNNGPTATYAWTFANAVPATSNLENPVGIHFDSPGVHQVTLIATEDNCPDTLVGFVTVNPDPIVDAGPDASFCEGDGGAELFGTGQGGTPIPPSNSAYYWTWWCDSTSTWCGLDSVYDDTPIASPNVSTMYYAQITDFNGCTSNIDSAFVTVIPKPLVFAGADVYICADSAPCVILNPSVTNSPGPFDYQWTPSVGLNNPLLANPCARPDTTTLYTLFVTDLGTGCSSNLTTVDSNSTVTVHVQPLPVAWAGPDKDVCLGDSVMLEGFGTNAGPTYGFQWSPATGLSDFTDANPMASPSATTEYVLTVWSNSCPSIGDTVKVTTHTLPTANAGPDVEICLGEVGMLDAMAFGDPFSNTYTFEWSPPTGVIGSTSVEDLLASPTATTTYSVIATSEFGCESAPDEAVLTVKPMPFAEAGEPITICSGDTLDLAGSYYYTTTDTVDDPSQILYTWFPGNNISSTTTPQTSVWPTGSAYYFLQLNYNTCSSLDSVLINVSPTPLAWVKADTTIICSNDSVLLTGGGGVGGATFTWSPTTGLSAGEGDSLWASPSETTTYIFTASEGQCADTDTLTLEVIPSPVVAYMSSLTEGCAPFDVSFLSTSSDVILTSWDFGDGSPTSNDLNPIHTYTNPGTYFVSLIGTNTGGCDDKVNSLVINVFAPPVADFTSNPDYPIQMSLPNTQVHFTDRSSTNAVSWLWNFGDGVSAEGTQASHTFMEIGEYMVSLRVTNDQGCVAEVTHGPYVVLNPELFIPNVFSPNDDNINDEFWVRYTGNQPFVLNIFDRWGNLVFTQRDKYAGWDGKFNNAPAPEGVYYYTVKVGDKEYSGNVTMVR